MRCCHSSARSGFRDVGNPPVRQQARKRIGGSACQWAFRDEPESPADFVRLTDALIQEKGWAAEGDSIVYVLRYSMGKKNLSNLVYIHQVGNF